MTELLQVTELRRAYGEVRALDGVSFAVQEGEMLGLVGPNGGGKSTLVDCIHGQARPAGGAVRLEGRRVTGLAPDAMSRRGVGRSFHALREFPAGSVRENLILAGQEHRGSPLARLFGRGDAGQGAAVEAMIGDFRLGAVADLPADALRFAERRLVDVAMGFMAGPRLVLLDEPAAGLNPAMLADLADRLRALNAERKATFIVVDQNLEFVVGLCTRVLAMADGKIIAEGAPEAIRHDPKVIEAYLGN